MLARGALGRLAADVPTTRTHDVPQLTRSLQRCLLARNVFNLPAARTISRAYQNALANAHRSYATTTRAAKVAEPVKKAVKTKAAPKTAPKKTTKTTATTTAKKTTKAAPKTKAVAKPKATKKTPAAKKAAPKKAAPKKRVKKVLTAEEQLKVRVRELRKVALREPCVPNQLHGRNVFVGEQLIGSKDTKKDLINASSKYQQLSPDQIIHYNHLAVQKNAERAAEYKAWLHSYTPDQIRLANNARIQLRKILKGALKTRHPAHTAKIVDDRRVKRPVNAFIHFFAERRTSGDFKNVSLGDIGKAIGEEWKTLPDTEKSKYEKQAEAERAAYSKATA